MTELYGLLLVPGIVAGTAAVGLSSLDERRRVWMVTRHTCLIAIAAQAVVLAAASAPQVSAWRPAAASLAAVVAVPTAIAGALALRDALVPVGGLLRYATRPLIGGAFALALAVAIGLPWLPAMATSMLGIGLASWVPLALHDPGAAVPAEPKLTRHTRETLLAVERLADPVAVQRRVVSELTKIFPGARLEVLRASDAPHGVLAGASSADAALQRAVAARGYMVRGRTRGLTAAQRRSFEATGASLLLPVRGGYTLYGLLRLDHDRVDRPMIVTARRFADLLGLKLETHRLHEEVSMHQRLAELGTLASGLAHDLRTPLSSIRMNLQMLEARQEDLGADAQCVEMGLRATERLNAHLATLLDYARPIELQREHVDLRALARDAVGQVEPLRRERNVRVNLEAAEELPRVAGDPMRLSRVLVNLLENAMKASPADTSVELVILHHPKGVQIVVRDQGHGIAPEDLAKLFDPFFTTRSDGTGLGLAMCKKIVDAHRGTITARTRSIGAEFRVLLPARRA